LFFPCRSVEKPRISARLPPRSGLHKSPCRA
jgi:hypothetical protein